MPADTASLFDLGRGGRSRCLRPLPEAVLKGGRDSFALSANEVGGVGAGEAVGRFGAVVAVLKLGFALPGRSAHDLPNDLNMVAMLSCAGVQYLEERDALG